MEEKVCLDINVPRNYIAPQFMCFPLVVVRADRLLQNWYYQNYMMPVARLDGVNSLTCDVADAITYGAGENKCGKIMQMNNINKTICAQLSNIVPLLKENIGKRYYCVLFLDFYYLSCAETYCGKNHFIHEMLFYGYDNIEGSFLCYGYFERFYRQVRLSYEEVQRSFSSALQYIEAMNGWEEYMLITMRRYDHKAESPYCGGQFLEKLEDYVRGDAAEQFQYDNLMYLKPTADSVNSAGRKVTGIFREYINMLERLADTESLHERIDSQITAFNIYKNYHIDIAERLMYYAKMNRIEGELTDYISDYQINIAEKSDEIRMLYIKFLCLVEKNLPVQRVLRSLKNEFERLDTYEKEILNNFISKSRQLADN